MMRTVCVFLVVALAYGTCPNGCSRNGICGANDKCSCFQNWQGADCSLRTCPYSLAWVDTADGTNSAHYYAECSNKGICDRKTAECKCFDGYEGKACRRSTCPESCSGHGTCEYIDELAVDFYDRRTGPGVRYSDLGGTKIGTTVNTRQALPTVVADTLNTKKYSGFLYDLWDAGKIQGCKCDLGYQGSDCSSRTVPKGDDPLTTVKSVHMDQVIGFTSNVAANDEFIIVYHDPYGGVWRTDAITVVGTGTSAATTAANIQETLRDLPNQVLSNVEVTATSADQVVCHRFEQGRQHIPAAGDGTYGHGTSNLCESGAVTFQTSSYATAFIVSFADLPGQTGVQYLLEVDGNARGAGSFPVSAGLTAGTTVSVAEINNNDNLGNLSELADCSDRGLDNGDGECECFEGFRGLACEEQEALV